MVSTVHADGSFGSLGSSRQKSRERVIDVILIGGYLAARAFAEQVPLLVDRYARRTRRLRSDFEEIGLMLGGRPGSRLSSRQKKPTSRMTLLRLVRALPEPAIETPQVLGVDEFAFRRGRRYGTIVIDGDDHHVIDLLEDPSAEALVGWLTEHPGAQVICRDRDGVYASAARRGAPTAMQVADRWHIVHNLVDALERMAVRVLAPLHKQRSADELSTLDKQRTTATLPMLSRIQIRNERRHAEIALEGWMEKLLPTTSAREIEDRYRALLKDNRARDAAAGRTLDGPHLSDFAVTHASKGIPASDASTGEQKALLIRLVLAHARLIKEMTGYAPLLLLDEVVAHLDPARRAALYDALSVLGAQVWMTGADPVAFGDIVGRAQVFEVRNGSVELRIH